jgi:TonB family protein
MRNLFGLLFIFSTVVQADMLDALKAYEQKNYAEARQQFAELLPLGNELAAFNLGAMAYYGEGQDKDLTEALAYFMLSAELEHPAAVETLQQLKQSAGDDILAAADEKLSLLKKEIKILPGSIIQDEADSLVPIKRMTPKYPIRAARNGIFGYVTVRLLVDEHGKVAAADTLDAYPENTFEQAALDAIKGWQYQPSEKQKIASVRLDFTLEGGVKISAVKKLIDKHGLLRYAQVGSPKHQLALGTLLSLASIQSGNQYFYDPQLPLDDKLDLSVLERQPVIKTDFKGFWGTAVVKVAKDGTIIEQLNASFEDKSEVRSLLGLKLRGQIKHDTYQLKRSLTVGFTDTDVVASVTVPRSMSSLFWWEQAAKNGEREAQRIMAAYNRQWERYLLSQQDAEVMAWTGTRLILEGQREQGMQLLDQAIAQNYQPATEMKQQFL